MGADSGERPSMSSNIDPTPVRFLAAQGVDWTTARGIVERATFDWQHGNTVVTPMRVAMEYVARARSSAVSP